jgi:hypothetical protein
MICVSWSLFSGKAPQPNRCCVSPDKFARFFPNKSRSKFASGTPNLGQIVRFFSPAFLRLFGVILMIGSAGTVWGVPFERTVSSSRQFIVFGGDPSLRGAIADLAEDSKSNVLALLQAADSWLVPILLNIQQPQANLPEIPPAMLNFS